MLHCVKCTALSLCNPISIPHHTLHYLFKRLQCPFLSLPNPTSPYLLLPLFTFLLLQGLALLGKFVGSLALIWGEIELKGVY